MKKLFYSLIIAAIAMVSNSAHAQYTITSSNVNVYPDSFCVDPYMSINSSGFTAGLQVHTWYGDGTDDINPLMSAFIGGTANYAHTYAAPGVYTIKQVLELGGASLDSVITSYNYGYCQTFNFTTYYDANSNCIYDYATDGYIASPLSIAIDSNGIRIDTFITTGGWGYRATGNPGDIYAFTVLNAPAGMITSCPSSGVLYDTVSPVVNQYINKQFGFDCSGVTGYDAGVQVSSIARRNAFSASIVVTNQFCNAAAVTLTMNLSPKYDYSSAYPAPTSVSGHTVTWNLPAVGATSPRYIYVTGVVPGAWLAANDTVHTSFSVTPTAGDADLTNNNLFIIDTVTASMDPNDKAVSPEGFVAPGAGTKLTYTIRFENTGNDTAFNIHIMDTLSDNVDVKSLAVVVASADMRLDLLKWGTHNVVKFDFPGINLLDSSHHNLCDGMVRFTVKTKDGLALGTQIHNRAGIYFDYNEVVMTNTVTNTVGINVGVDDMSNVAVSNIQLFPNPADNELTIKISNGTYSTISVVNSVGQEVIKQNVTGVNTKLNVKALPAGSYYISVKGNSGVKVERFQKM